MTNPTSGLLRRVCTLSAGVLAVSLLVVGTAAAAPPPTPVPPPVAPARLIPLPPELDSAFYAPPADVVAHTAPGGIIAARQVNVGNLGLIPLNVDGWQVSFRSNNTVGQPIAAVTTLLKPRGVSSAPRKLLSMQLAEDSTEGYCAPSYALQELSVAALAGQIVVPAEFVFAQAALQQGWAVAIPDYEGPNSAYAAGPLGGRITLDGIRAATEFAPLGVGKTAPIGLYGYSGGSIATGHAAELHHSYAPDLNIVAAAEGGVGADLGAALAMADNQLTSGLVLAAVMGLTREYPDFAQFVAQHTDPLGRALMAVKAPLCVQYQSMLLPFLNITGLLHIPGDPMRAPAVRKIIDETRMGNSLPDMPLFMWHSAWDEILPLASTNQLVDTYCRNPKASVQYTRDHGSEHIIGEIAGGPAALMWLRDRFDGVPAQHGCTTADVASMALTPGEIPFAGAILGNTVLSLFGKPIGT